MHTYSSPREGSGRIPYRMPGHREILCHRGGRGVSRRNKTVICHFQDVLFDFHTKKVIKFVLHTNMPGHYDFGM